MVKPYSIFKAQTGIYYVQFRLSNGIRSSSKSTGSRNRAEAEKILTLEQAAAVFKTDWENASAKLTNELAFYTGMRHQFKIS